MPILPARLTTPRLVLRHWQPDDRAAYELAVSGSFEHLSPWLPWARLPVEELWDELQTFLKKPETANDTLYAIFDSAESTVLGGLGVHDRGEDHERELGYWLCRAATGSGYMTEAVTEVTTAVFAAMPITSITIVCDPANVRSAGVPRRAGYSLEGIFPVRIINPDRTENMIWRVARDAWQNRRNGL